ncbi:hypothetical protein [Streptomyces noursei]|uniref:hypothetical protein n=1 Tax=Streptomyces noursei TaxID=1971 RepID=UPI001F044642|nr:hypothetical protein [Streptomyces noursei]
MGAGGEHAVLAARAHHHSTFPVDLVPRTRGGEADLEVFVGGDTADERQRRHRPTRIHRAPRAEELLDHPVVQG